MKLEIKHLAPYLPYWVKVSNNTHPDDVNLVIGLRDETYFIEQNSRYAYGDIENCKLLLRPLSDLTKEIEINGKKFVPIYELCDVFNVATYYSDHTTIKKSCKYTSSGGSFYTIWGNCNLIIKPTHEHQTVFLLNVDIKHITRSPYWLLEKLFEWHFDVFGLIEQNLAIAIND